MRLLNTALMSFLLGTSACMAQSAPAAAPPAAAAPVAQSPPADAPASGKLKGKEVRANCRAEAEAKGLKGPEKKAAVQDCFAKARPDLAAAAECRKEGKAKGLADKELRAFVKTCKKGK